MGRHLRNAILALAALGLVSCAPPPEQAASQVPDTVARGGGEDRQGAAVRQEILKRFGGEYRDPRVQAYVRDVGRRLAAVSDQPNARWTFTVLNSPEINAFATPGGYVYVTRGLLALAEDEAELASVIGHEIAHVTVGHNAARQRRSTQAGIGVLLGQIGLAVLGADPQLANVLGQAGQAAAGGYVASYSRQDELEADNLGIRYMARAGYDVTAAADFLESLAAFSALRASIKGQEYDPNQVSFLASHPATGQRVAIARRVAGTVGAQGGERGEGRHLATIDGIVWGDSADQGFVRNGVFAHPELGFIFRAPRGFTITNSASAVIAEGPNGARFIMDGGRDPGGRLTDYIRRGWLPAIARSTRVGQIRRLDELRINGLPAARALVPVQVGNRVYDALLVAIRLDGSIYRFTGLAPQGSRVVERMMDAAGSFRRLSGREAQAYRATRIDVVPVSGRQSVESLGRAMAVEARPIDHFVVLNGLNRRGGAGVLRPGERVKLIR